jgi:hypothetical protein
MRTKLILTTAALGVSSLGALAQVYSVNAVGYINVTIPANGFGVVANQLNTGNNTIAEVIPTAPPGTIVYKYSQATGFSVNAWDDLSNAWGNPTETLRPGEGFFVANNQANPLTITFVGEVPQGNRETTLAQGLNLVGSQVPQAGGLSTALGYTAAEGDTVYQWDAATQQYKNPSSFQFEAWDPSEPTIAVGEGFFISKGAAGSWTRNFSVNP